jgi:uncharacterized protein involved in response to NO
MPSRPSFEAVFSYGFRPFFLGSAVYAVLAMTLWIAWIASGVAGLSQSWLPIAGSPFAWHAHEMVFGFAAAAIGGFLLTAVPNWTGALPLSGPPLILLFGVWLFGRVAMDVSADVPYAIVAGIDLMFLPLLGGFAARQLFMKPALRNLVFLVLIAALTLCNLGFHLGTGEYLPIEPLASVRVAMLIVVVMIAVIGGRIIPAFTHNWLHGSQPQSTMPRRINWLDRASLASLLLFVVLEVVGAPALGLGVAALIAAISNGARLVLWQGASTRKEPIVWILHLGYGWIVVGLVLSALAAFTSVVPAVVASHAFGTGAVGTMIVAVMSRASLGHTGRRLIAPRAIVWAYYLVTLAAAMRVAGPLIAPQHSAFVLSAAALAWIGAFFLFVVVYAPILTTPRVHTKVAHR